MNISKSMRWSGVIAVAAAILFASVAAWTLTNSGSSTAQEAVKFQSREAVGHAKQLSEAFRTAAREVLPSVVTIQTIASRRPAAEPDRRQNPYEGRENPFKGTPFEDFFKGQDLERFFDQAPSRPRPGQTGLGTGVIIHESGIILTNNHVVSGGGTVQIRLNDGREFEATKVSTDPRTDLAVVWIEDAGSLDAATLGDSDRMEIGDWVLAVGNPFGLFESVTAGIISAKGRGLGIADREEFLQHDAAINPGNSGGPLINLDGEVIGINTAISSRSGGYQGAGFAIPSNLARWVARQLVDSGLVRRAYLGTVIQPITPTLARKFGVAVGSGVLISQPMPGSPAEEAGLEAGDVVKSFAGKKITNPRELQAAVETAKIGSKQPIEIIRDGKEMTLRVQVRQQPKDFGHREFARSTTPHDSETLQSDELGFELSELTEETAERLGVSGTEGVVITSVKPGSPAATAGLESGMVISQVDRKPVKNLDGYKKAIQDHKEGDSVLLLVRSQAGSRFLVVRPED